MSSIPSEPPTTEISSPWKSAFKKLVNSHWTFIGLQALDLLTTMLAFRMGALEVNPLVAQLTVIFGMVAGVARSFVTAVAAATAPSNQRSFCDSYLHVRRGKLLRSIRC